MSFLGFSQIREGVFSDWKTSGMPNLKRTWAAIATSRRCCARSTRSGRWVLWIGYLRLIMTMVTSHSNRLLKNAPIFLKTPSVDSPPRKLYCQPFQKFPDNFYHILLFFQISSPRGKTWAFVVRGKKWVLRMRLIIVFEHQICRNS